MPTKGTPIRESAAHRKARAARAAKRQREQLGVIPALEQAQATYDAGYGQGVRDTEKRKVGKLSVGMTPERVREWLAGQTPVSHPIKEPTGQLVYAHENARRHVIHPGPYVVLVGDIVSGFEAFGPFESGTDAVRWKQNKGVREFTQGQWFLLPLKEVV